MRPEVYLSNRPACTYNYYFAETTTAPLQRSIDYHPIHVVKKIIADCYENNKQHIECSVFGKNEIYFCVKIWCIWWPLYVKHFMNTVP
jgi:hypothetical protein